MKLEAVQLNITEKEYRDLPSISYSMLSAISRLGPSALKSKESTSEAMMFGTMVDSMIDGSFKRDDYYFAKTVDIGEKIKPAIDILLNRLENIEGDFNSDLTNYEYLMTSILKNNYIDYYLKRTPESRASSIIKDKGAQEYFKFKIEGKDKIIITIDMYEDALQCVNILRTHKFTKKIFSNKLKEAYYQFKYQWSEKGTSFKGMIDRLIIDHENKIIKPYDLKTGSKSLYSFTDSFYKYRYDIQAVMYYVICKLIRDEHYPDYEVDTFKFIYIGRFEKLPIIWEVPKTHHSKTILGFSRNNKDYKGIKQLMEEYEFYVKNPESLEYSKEVYDNEGTLTLDTKYLKKL